jgi:hypothetical protein
MAEPVLSILFIFWGKMGPAISFLLRNVIQQEDGYKRKKPTRRESSESRRIDHDKSISSDFVCVL